MDYGTVAKSCLPQDDPYIAIFLSNAQVAATIAMETTLFREAFKQAFEVCLQKFAKSLSSSMRELNGKEQEVVSDRLISGLWQRFV